MEKIKDFIKKHPAIDFVVIIFIMLLFALLFGNYFCFIYTDRGREFLLPQEILNGAVPYKDITLIYFPLAYYINALIYKLLGVSINSLLVSQTILCTIIFFCILLFSKRVY